MSTTFFRSTSSPARFWVGWELDMREIQLLETFLAKAKTKMLGEYGAYPGLDWRETEAAAKMLADMQYTLRHISNV